jgi:hypothetical protein
MTSSTASKQYKALGEDVWKNKVEKIVSRIGVWIAGDGIYHVKRIKRDDSIS